MIGLDTKFTRAEIRRKNEERYGCENPLDVKEKIRKTVGHNFELDADAIEKNQKDDPRTILSRKTSFQ